MTKISDKRLAEMIVSAENHGEAGFSYVHTKDYIIALKELTALRAHNSDSAEPVAWSLVWNEGYGVNADTTFKHKDRAEEYAMKCGEPKPRVVPLYLASPPAKEVGKAFRHETGSENIARDMEEGRFPEQSAPQLVPTDEAIELAAKAIYASGTAGFTCTYQDAAKAALSAIMPLYLAPPLAQEVERLRLALKNLLDANEAVQLVLCDGPEVPGFDPTALGRAQLKVVDAERAAQIALTNRTPDDEVGNG